MDHLYKCRVCGADEHQSVMDGIKDWEYGYDGVYSYYRCSNCSSVQLHPFPCISDLVEAYKVDYHGFAVPVSKGAIYSFLYKMSDWFNTREIKRYIDSNSRILDVGCGIGLFLSKLKSIGFDNIEGIDFSETAVENVRAKGISCHLGTFLEFNKESHSYDLIAMNNYLEHTLNPLEELKKARVLLKDDGVLMCELPNFDSCDRYLFGKYWGGNHVPRHTFQFNKDNLKSLLTEAGFTRVTIQYPLNTSHFALSIQNYFQRNYADLKNNKRLRHGRDRYYTIYMLALIPINILCVLTKKTGFMKLYARP